MSQVVRPANSDLRRSRDASRESPLSGDRRHEKVIIKDPMMVVVASKHEAD